MTTTRLVVPSPVGTLCLTAEHGEITRVDWTDDTNAQTEGNVDSNLLATAAQQLDAYFAGTAQKFDLPLAPAGTDHDRAVWHCMQRIPFGTTRSYGEIANEIGSSARAVGGACGRNPIPVIIPCHRVLAANGGIGGYSGDGGIDTKHRLLALEGAMLAV